jgi:predicted oxidoreductase
MQLGRSELPVPVIALGCMRLNSLSKQTAADFIHGALDLGANFFDHADIYGGGACETVFAEAIGMNPGVRETIILQSKCGIRQGAYDFSREYILESTEGILRRLRTEYLDLLLLHRPDTLMEGEELAEAFSSLHASGKVRYFGVSNMNPFQIQLLQRYLAQPIQVNQLQLSLTNAGMISSGLHTNMLDDASVNRDGGVLEFCRLQDITIQPWSPFQYGFFEGVFLGNKKFPALNKKIDELAEKYGVSATAIVIAWLLRHPAKFQPVTGTTNLARLRDCIAGTEIKLSREEWYALYLAAGNTLP